MPGAAGGMDAGADGVGLTPEPPDVDALLRHADAERRGCLDDGIVKGRRRPEAALDTLEFRRVPRAPVQR